MNAVIDHFVFAYDDDENDDDLEDVILLHILHADELLGNRAALYGAFNFNALNNTQCLSLFRFRKEDMNILKNALGLPEQLNFNRIPILGRDGLCMLLRRLTYPNRLVDLEPIFGYSSMVISEACNLVLQFIAQNKGHLLDNLRNIPYLNYQKLVQFSQIVEHKLFGSLSIGLSVLDSDVSATSHLTLSRMLQILQLLVVNPNRQQFNNEMRALKVSVEWGFNKIIKLFAFLDFKKNQKLLVQDVSSMYRVGVLLSNCHTCLYGAGSISVF